MLRSRKRRKCEKYKNDRKTLNEIRQESRKSPHKKGWEHRWFSKGRSSRSIPPCCTVSHHSVECSDSYSYRYALECTCRYALKIHPQHTLNIQIVLSVHVTSMGDWREDNILVGKLSRFEYLFPSLTNSSKRWEDHKNPSNIFSNNQELL